MNNPTIKKQLLATINTVVPLGDYVSEDCIFSQKYPFSPVAMVYILKQLAEDFRLTITDDFVDALEMCTFANLEKLLNLNSTQ